MRLSKYISSVLGMVLTVSMLTLSVSAASFYDDCASLSDLPSRKFFNLNSANDYLSNLQANLKDRTGFSLTDYNQKGELTYEVDHITEVYVDLYRQSPSFAYKADEQTILPAFILLPEECRDPIPMYIDEAALADGENDFLYCIDGNDYYKFVNNSESFYMSSFIPTDKPDRTLIPYGLEIQYSTDGAAFDSCENEDISLSPVAKSSEDYPFMYKERFHAIIPEDSTQIRILLHQIPETSVAPKPPAFAAIINKVTMLGSNGTMPEEQDNIDPQPEIKPVPPENDSNSNEEDTDKDTDKESSDKKPSKGSASSSSSSKTPSLHLSNSTSTNTSSSQVDSSSTTSTTDSNNSHSESYTTTTTTINNIFIGEDGLAQLQEILKNAGIDVDSLELSDESPKQLLPTEEKVTIVYDDSQKKIPDNPLQYSQETPSDTPENGEDTMLYLLICGIGTIIILQIITLLVPKKSSEPEPEQKIVEDSSDEDELY